MKNGIFRLLLASLLLSVMACSTTPSETDDGSISDISSPAEAPTDEFAEFESTEGGNPEASIENELAGGSATSEAPPVDSAAADEFAEFDQPPVEPTADQLPPAEALADQPPAVDPGPEQVVEAPAPEPIPEPAVDHSPEVVAEAPPPVEEPVPEAPVATGEIVNITSIQYRANDNGGTIVIEGDGPLNFQPRMNTQTNQFIIEVPDSKLPRKLKRPLNTRDFAGTIGSIDAYQGQNSTTARIVVQLRPGAPEPTVQAEGNTLFVVAQPPASESIASNNATEDGELEATSEAGTSSKLMSSDSIEEFLANNQSFYGKRISIETDDADLRDVFRLISEESNVNLILSDEVRGRISLKLKNVPWDQAFVMIMKSKKLGYTRAGNVLRIAPMTDIKTEEDDAIKYLTAKKANAPFKVRNVTVNYAKVEDLEKQIKPLLTQKGSVIADPRTSSLIITDIDENILRAEKLVRALDVPPQQVLIEGKVVEAKDDFRRSIGVNWGLSGRPSAISGGRSSSGPLRGSSNLNMNSFANDASSSLRMGFSLGTMDILGDLSATLNLFEQQNLVKVVSSPRILTLHNEPAEINQTQEIPVLTSTPTQIGTPVVSVTYKPIKLRLQVTPQITNDGVVILGVDVARDTQGAIAPQAQNAISVDTRSVKTRVIVRNGQTAVIGGIYQNDTTTGETKVPMLGDVPIVGWLFKSRTNTKNRTELITFITPRIVGQLEGNAGPSEPLQGVDDL